MSRRLVAATIAVGTVTALAVGGLYVLGATDTDVSATTGYAGWTGRAMDTTAVADKSAMTPDDAVAVTLLERSATASRSVAYSGRAVVQDRTGATTTELLHVPGRGTVATVVGSGPQQAVFSPDGRSGSFADAGRQLDLLRVNYRVLREAALDTSVAGRPPEAVVAVDGDGEVAARYWLDAATGLLLRKELVAPSGAVWSRAGFDRITFDVDTGAVDAASATAPDDPWGDQLDAAGLKAVRQAGCDCPDTLPGGLSLVETRRAPAGTVGSVPVVHQVFSDGLMTVSLFSMPGELSTADQDGLRARGFTLSDLDGLPAWVRTGTAGEPASTVVWVCDDSVLTLVSDDVREPLGLAGAVLSALPPSASSEPVTFVDRVARGWARLTGGRA